MTTEAPKQQLDHATARIVTELAAALLPHLKETVSAELIKAIESMPVNIDREVEEALLSLKRLQALVEDMTGALNSAQSSASRLSNELLPLSRTCETLIAATTRIEQLMSEKPEMNNGVQANDELLRSLETNLHDWGGILKANGRAQTKEFSEFSTEISEQVSWMKSNMPDILRETLGKMLSSRAEESLSIGEVGKNVHSLEDRLTKLEKIGKMILAGGIVLIAVLTAAAVALYFK